MREFAHVQPGDPLHIFNPHTGTLLARAEASEHTVRGGQVEGVLVAGDGCDQVRVNVRMVELTPAGVHSVLLRGMGAGQHMAVSIASGMVQRVPCTHAAGAAGSSAAGSNALGTAVTPPGGAATAPTGALGR